jgi:hypothetical protein
MRIAVYTLYTYNHWGHTLVGIYSSLDKAKQATKGFPYQRTKIDTVIVDK